LVVDVNKIDLVVVTAAAHALVRCSMFDVLQVLCTSAIEFFDIVHFNIHSIPSTNTL
jgi:hypothetical protein